MVTYKNYLQIIIIILVLNVKMNMELKFILLENVLASKR